MRIKTIGKTVNEDTNQLPLVEWVRDQLDLAQENGYTLIEGLFDSNSNNVYKIIALCKYPNNWEPYRAPRHLRDVGAFAICWWFDDELTYENMEGNMIYEDFDEYEGLDDEDTFEDEPDPEPNTAKYELVESVGEWVYNLEYDGHKDSLISRLTDIMECIKSRTNDDIKTIRGIEWKGAFRSDERPEKALAEDFDEYEGLDDEDTFEDEPEDPEYYSHVIKQGEIFDENGLAIAIVDWVIDDLELDRNERSEYYYLWTDLTNYPPLEFEDVQPEGIFNSWDEMVAGLKPFSRDLIRTALKKYQEHIGWYKIALGPIGDDDGSASYGMPKVSFDDHSRPDGTAAQGIEICQQLMERVRGGDLEAAMLITMV